MKQPVVIIQESEDWTAVEHNSINAVVQVFAQIAEFNWLEPYKIDNHYEQRGTGFIISDDGEIITSAHVIDQAKMVWVQMPILGQKNLYVDSISFCPDRDLALLRLRPRELQEIKAVLSVFPKLLCGDSDKLGRTDKILVLGYPLGQYHLKSTTGIVSGREVTNDRTYLQITAPINPGNSGGPLLTLTGEVVGIAVAAAEPAQNVGYAVPINEVTLVLEDMRSQPLVRKHMLGIRFNNASDILAGYLGNPIPSGLYINNVIQGSLSDQAGLKAGDVLYQFNDIKIDEFGEASVEWSVDKVTIYDLISRLQSNQQVKLVVYRKGVRTEVSFIFGTTSLLPIRTRYPQYETIDYEVIAGMVIMELDNNHIDLLGEINPFLINYVKIEHRIHPQLIVTHIVPGSLVHQIHSFGAGSLLQKINGIAVGTLEELRNALKQSIKTSFMTIETTDDILVVFLIQEVLDTENQRARDFMYPVSSGVQQLQKLVKQK